MFNSYLDWYAHLSDFFQIVWMVFFIIASAIFMIWFMYKCDIWVHSDLNLSNTHKKLEDEEFDKKLGLGKYEQVDNENKDN